MLQLDKKDYKLPKNLNYALFGGSFDPPHLGHLEIVKKVLQFSGVDRVLITPTYLNPFKNSSFVDAKKRLTWVKQTLGSVRNSIVSSFEIEQNRAVYTIETLQELGKTKNIKYIVIGTDNLKKITMWKDFKKLNSNYIWIVATREGQNIDTTALDNFIILKLSADISSSEIRSGKKLDFLDEKIKKQVVLEYNLNKKGNE